MVSNFTGFNTAIGIGIVIGTDGSITINACEISKNNNQLDFQKKTAGLASVKDLHKHFPVKSIIALNITGKGVLYKKVDRIEAINSANFSQILTNAKFEDFYIQNFIAGEQSFISVIRKTEADKWIKELVDEGFNPVVLSLGPFAAVHILPQLNVYEQEVIFDGNVVKRDEQGIWINYRYDQSRSAPFPLKIENEQISEKIVLAYASAFQVIMANSLDPVKVNVDELEIAYEQVVSTKKIKVYASLILGGLFFLLLINFMLFSYYDSANAKLTYQVSSLTQNTNQIKNSADQIKTKELRLLNLGWDGGINKAYLIDQLASELPSEINWKELSVNPIDVSGSRNQRTILFKDRQIRVTGLSQKIIPVNEWMARMKIKKWVKDIQLENYSFNTELNTGQFIVVLTY